MSKIKLEQSGNPIGRPKGNQNRVTLVTQALLDGKAQVLTRKVVELAESGKPMPPGCRLSVPPSSMRKSDPRLRDIQSRVTGP